MTNKDLQELLLFAAFLQSKVSCGELTEEEKKQQLFALEQKLKSSGVSVKGVSHEQD